MEKFYKKVFNTEQANVCIYIKLPNLVAPADLHTLNRKATTTKPLITARGIDILLRVNSIR